MVTFEYRFDVLPGKLKEYERYVKGPGKDVWLKFKGVKAVRVYKSMLGRIVPAAARPGRPREPRGAREHPHGFDFPQAQANVPRPRDARQRLAAHPGERQAEMTV